MAKKVKDKGGKIRKATRTPPFHSFPSRNCSCSHVPPTMRRFQRALIWFPSAIEGTTDLLAGCPGSGSAPSGKNLVCSRPWTNRPSVMPSSVRSPSGCSAQAWFETCYRRMLLRSQARSSSAHHGTSGYQRCSRHCSRYHQSNVLQNSGRSKDSGLKNRNGTKWSLQIRLQATCTPRSYAPLPQSVSSTPAEFLFPEPLGEEHNLSSTSLLTSSGMKYA